MQEDLCAAHVHGREARNEPGTLLLVRAKSDGVAFYFGRECLLLPACLSACLSVCLPVHLSVCLPVCLSACLSVCLCFSLGYWLQLSVYLCVSHDVGKEVPRVTGGLATPLGTV